MNDDYEDLLNLDKELDSRFNKILINEKNGGGASNLTTRPNRFGSKNSNDAPYGAGKKANAKSDLNPASRMQTETKRKSNGNEDNILDKTKIFLKNDESQENSQSIDIGNGEPKSNEIQPSQNGHHKSGSTKPIEKASSEDELSLDEFLSNAAELKIRTIEKRCDTLKEALKKAHEKIKCMNLEMSEAEKTAKEASREAASSKKALSSREVVLKKRDTALRDLTDEMVAQKLLYQELSKEKRAVEKKCHEEGKRGSSLQKEGERMRARLQRFGEEGARRDAERKEEECRLRSKLSAADATCGDLRRTVFGLTELVRKQEQLVAVLQDQKRNLAAAKVTKAMEEELVALVEGGEDAPHR